MFARLSLLLLLAACSVGGGPPPDAGGKEEEEEVQPDPRTLVEIAPVTRGVVRDQLVGSASVESEAQASLAPEASGTVTGIFVDEGDTVTKGQLLATIANPSLEGGYERASAELERTQADYATAQRLFAQNAISGTELEAAKRALEAARTAAEEATRTRGFTRLVSPIAGTVATRNLKYGEVASPGVPGFVVVDLDRLRVVVNLPERELARVRTGQPATLVSAYDEKAVATGKVGRVAPVVDSRTGTFRANITLDPGQTTLRPGQFVSVQIEVARKEGVLTVPRRAVVWEEGRSYVYTVAELTAEEIAKEEEEKKKKEEEEKKAGGGMQLSFGGGKEEEKKEPEIPGPRRKATRVAVEVGYQDGDTVELVSGVAEGASVVTVGNEALRDGAPVRLPGDPTIASKKAEEKKADDAGTKG